MVGVGNAVSRKLKGFTGPAWELGPQITAPVYLQGMPLRARAAVVALPTCNVGLSIFLVRGLPKFAVDREGTIRMELTGNVLWY